MGEDEESSWRAGKLHSCVENILPSADVRASIRELNAETEGLPTDAVGVVQLGPEPRIHGFVLFCAGFCAGLRRDGVTVHPEGPDSGLLTKTA